MNLVTFTILLDLLTEKELSKLYVIFRDSELGDNPIVTILRNALVARVGEKDMKAEVQNAEYRN